MAEIKYKYAYDESDKLVSIENYTKETSKLHTYHCITCGHTLLPRALGSKKRRAHFYHKDLVECSGETYLHKLAKQLIKQTFDNSETFFVAYDITKSCNAKKCKLKNINCNEKKEIKEIDLKKYYDACAEEEKINGFVSDLLLTHSDNKKIQPILIEICVTHPCEIEKISSGMQIIEITIEKEEDIYSIVEQRCIKENSTERNKPKIR